MHRPFLFTALLSVAVAVPRETNACLTAAPCSCVEVPADQRSQAERARIARAHSIFAGKVRELVRPDSQTLAAVIEVARWWKGVGIDTVVVVIHSWLPAVNSCDMVLAVGQEYLIFLDNPRKTVRHCTGSRPLQEAAAEGVLTLLGPGRVPG